MPEPCGVSRAGSNPDGSTVKRDGSTVKRLRQIRHERARFDGRFFERHPAFWPLARAASTFATAADWPDVRDYRKAFEGEPPVEFEPAPLKRKRPAGLVVREQLYDASIIARRMVPTRARMWHDYLNALVWATFPEAKLELHRRQHTAIERWIPEGATHLPNARTRELDALALVDEGGVIVHGDTTIIFGHAIFEGLVFGQPAMISRAIVFDPPCQHADAQNLIRCSGAFLAETLADSARFLSPGELSRLPLELPP